MLYETKFLISLGLTSAIEIPVVVIMSRYIFRFRKISVWKLIFIGFLASALTLPYLWFILPPYIDARFYILYGESLVVLVETILYYKLLGIKLWKAFLISLIANMASYFFAKYLF